MEERVLGRSGRRVAVIGLGAWQLGADWGEVSDESAHTSRAPPAVPVIARCQTAMGSAAICVEGVAAGRLSAGDEARHKPRPTRTADGLYHLAGSPGHWEEAAVVRPRAGRTRQGSRPTRR